jgi:hypothetical protein
MMNQMLEEAKDDETKQQSTVNFQQKIHTAKEQLQRSKEHAINESKLFLSKRMAEMERDLNEISK